MSAADVLASLTRIAGLRERPYQAKPIPKAEWATGDYVVGEVLETPGSETRVELENGRMIEVVQGDRVVGAFGVRRATLEAVGSWQEIIDDHVMQSLTSAGLFGRVTSRSLFMPALLSLRYYGHVIIDGHKAVMRDFVPGAEPVEFTTPVVLVVGTSMSAGKTAAAKQIVRQLKKLGRTVLGAKLTGAGRYRDILGMADAGADIVLDFVDAGLPSTVSDPDEFRHALRGLLARMQGVGADVVVAEVGASPMEPYNVDVAIDEVRKNIRCTVLCASDPYAAVGLGRAFGVTADLVAGLATSNEAGIALVKRLTGVPALNILARESRPEIRALLEEKLDL